MIQIKGNKQIELNQKDLKAFSEDFDEVIIDLGTGDGRYVYKNAKENSNKLYIGIDPSAKQLEVYSKKARKDKIHNAIFVVGSLEVFPLEIVDFADQIHIILPWGSLLKNVVDPEPENLKNLALILKKEGNLNIIFGYSTLFEPSETNRLELPENIDFDYINSTIIPKFTEKSVFALQDANTLTKEDLFNFETTWSKKLSFGENRPLFQLILKKC